MANKFSKQKGKPVAVGDWTRINSNLYIYRNLRTRKQNWVAKIRTGSGESVSRSTKTDDLPTAIQRAIVIYDQIQDRVRNEIPLSDCTVEDCLRGWLKHAEKKLSAGGAHQVKAAFTNIFEPWLINEVGHAEGLKTKVVSIKKRYLAGFAEYRERLHENKYSRTTLQCHISCWNRVLNYAKNKLNMLDKPYLIPKLRDSQYSGSNSPTTAVVRPSINTFSEEQIKVLDHWIRTQLLRVNGVLNKNIVNTEKGQSNKRIIRADGSTSSNGDLYLTRVNLFGTYWLMRNCSLRTQEAQYLKWKHVKKSTITNLDKASKHNPKGEIFVLHIEERKSSRLAILKDKTRIVIGPFWLQNIFDLIKRENPSHSDDESFVFNFRGVRRDTQAKFFQKVLKLASEGNKYNIDCTSHSSGTGFSLGHLRSYFISNALLTRHINPIVVSRIAGVGLNTIMNYYLTNEPTSYVKELMGGHRVTVHPDLLQSIHTLKNPF
tara:strand:+ start:3537 stop:5000 length:1464 start_codon:yes stop_codon:yes gene_type:complete